MNMGCQRRTGDAWSRSVCGKTPVETFGIEQLCKRHASAARGAMTARAKRRAIAQTREQIEQDWCKRTKEAASTLGVSAQVHYSVISHKRTEDVVISLADFERLAARVEARRLEESR